MSDSDQVPASLAAVIGIAGFIIGAWLAHKMTVECQHTEAIDHQSAHYEAHTGEFTWNLPWLSETPIIRPEKKDKP